MAKILIDVSDDILQHINNNGYEITEFRIPKAEEKILYDMDRISTAGVGWNAPRLILKKKFVWPEWLKCRWIAKSPDGAWLAINGNMVTMTNDGWYATYSPFQNGCITPISALVDTSSFPNVPWKVSLMENPNYVQTSN